MRKAVLALAVVMLVALAARTPAPATSPIPPWVRVSGNHLVVGGSGDPLILRGVNRSGTEYACIQGWGIFDGPSDDASIHAMLDWKINAVRVPLNEDCWLGINGVGTKHGGANYRNAINDYVVNLHSHGLYVILDLHVAAPGTRKSTDIIKMADKSHAPAFWRSVATRFNGYSGVIFDLYNEPHDISWACWKNGCTVDGYQTAGMKQLLAAVRGTGAKNVVMMGGVRWSADPSQWKRYVPFDAEHQVALSLHSYNFNGCNTSACRSQVAAIALTYPVIAGEIGENDCAHGYIDGLMNWLDSVKASYLGWTWDAGGGWTCTGGPTLITSYDGTPTNFGIGFKNHLAAL